MPQEGSQAPEFTLPDQMGNLVSLKEYRGQWVLVYFYPKDDTPGCTEEACQIRDNLPQFIDLQAVVLGISTDSVTSHKKFADKYGLPFTLLADEEKEVVQQYGVWSEKSMYGKTYHGVTRSSFLVSPDGIIVKVYDKVKPAVHATEVLADLKELRP